MRKKAKGKNYRKKPKQQRAAETISLIYEATTQLLQQGDRLKVNTNKIAQKAGMSIGSIYQYFSDKESIMEGLSDSLMERDLKKVEDAFKDIRGKKVEDKIRSVIQMLVGVFTNQKKMRIFLMRLASVDFVINQRDAFTKKFVQFFLKELNALAPSEIAPQTELSVYILLEAVLGVIRMALLSDSAYLGTKEFEDELVKLVFRYLQP